MPVDVPVLQPPAIYRHMPSMYPLSDEVRPYDEVNKRCHEYMEKWGNFSMIGRPINGCQRMVNGTCMILRVDSLDVLEHEIAHCNRWPKDHPGGVWINLPPSFYRAYDNFGR
jgi:hypothetical protein